MTRWTLQRTIREAEKRCLHYTGVKFVSKVALAAYAGSRILHQLLLHQSDGFPFLAIINRVCDSFMGSTSPAWAKAKPDQ